jgi:hypothetical protein
MRRLVTFSAVCLAVLWVAVPAQAFAHNNVHNQNLHALLDGLTLLVVSAPVWTALLWGRGSRWWLAGLIAVVQVPVAVIGFLPINDPMVHLAAFVLALTLTGSSIAVVRRQARLDSVARPRPVDPAR